MRQFRHTWVRTSLGPFFCLLPSKLFDLLWFVSMIYRYCMPQKKDTVWQLQDRTAATGSAIHDHSTEAIRPPIWLVGNDRLLLQAIALVIKAGRAHRLSEAIGHTLKPSIQSYGVLPIPIRILLEVTALPMPNLTSREQMSFYVTFYFAKSSDLPDITLNRKKKNHQRPTDYMSEPYRTLNQVA